MEDIFPFALLIGFLAFAISCAHYFAKRRRERKDWKEIEMKQKGYEKLEKAEAKKFEKNYSLLRFAEVKNKDKDIRRILKELAEYANGIAELRQFKIRGNDDFFKKNSSNPDLLKKLLKEPKVKTSFREVFIQDKLVDKTEFEFKNLVDFDREIAGVLYWGVYKNMSIENAKKEGAVFQKKLFKKPLEGDIFEIGLELKKVRIPIQEKEWLLFNSFYILVDEQEGLVSFLFIGGED